jgi:hypothetical protein
MVEASGTEDVVEVVTLERETLDRSRTLAPMYRDRRPEIYGRLTSMQEMP